MIFYINKNIIIDHIFNNIIIFTVIFLVILRAAPMKTPSNCYFGPPFSLYKALVETSRVSFWGSFFKDFKYRVKKLENQIIEGTN